MSYQSKTFNVMIASPSDVAVQKVIVREEIYEWNAIHSMHRKIVLLPVAWDSHTSPEMGGRPQGIINEQVLDNCDLLVAIFGTRLGTDTGKHESGTVEEIREHIERDKPVMLYFSTTLGDTANFDAEQFKRLQEFQKWCSDKGLYETFDSDNVFRHKFSRQLQIKLNHHSMFKAPTLESSQLDTSDLKLDLDDSEPVFSRSKSSVPSADPALSLHPDLSERARVMLKSAALDPSGFILVVTNLGGTDYQVNNESLNRTHDRRELASWDEARDQLEKGGLIRRKDATGTSLRLYEMTASGYAIADLLTDTHEWIA